MKMLSLTGFLAFELLRVPFSRSTIFSKDLACNRRPGPIINPQWTLYRDADPEFVKRQDQKRSELDEQLKDYITEWRKQRNKEEEELKRLKEKQAKRKVTRAEEEQRMAQRKKEEEERRVREVEEKKQREADEKRMRLEEAEKKRQAMIQAQKDKDRKGPNFTIQKREDGNVSISQAAIKISFQSFLI